MNHMEGKGTADTNLPWLWVIEYLASCERMNLQLLLGVVESAPILQNDLGKNLRELISLSCLEQLCENAAINETTSDHPPDLDPAPMFELSRSSEDVLGNILLEGSVSDFRLTGEQLKSQVCQFIMLKRTTLPKSALQQLKDSIVRDTYPEAASLKLSGGVTWLTDDNRVLVGNVGHSDTCGCQPDRTDNDHNIETNGKLNTAEHHCLEQQLEEDSMGRTSTPSKRNITALDAENSSQNYQENQHIGDDFPIHSPSSKKLKQSIPDANKAERSNTIVIESDSYSGRDAGDKFDFAQDQIETSAEHRVVEECAENHDPQKGISDKLHRNKDGHAVQKSTVRIDYGTSLKPMDDSSTFQFQQRETIDEDVVCLRDQRQVEELSSDSDEYLNDDINISMKEEFLASHCASIGGSLESLEQMKQNICMKCNEGGQLLVCCSNSCPLVVHKYCVDSSNCLNEDGNFLCLFCRYSNAISEYLEAKKEATSARKDLPAFLCTLFQERGGQGFCANNVDDLQQQSEECTKRKEEHQINVDTRNQVKDYQLQSGGGFGQDSDQNTNSLIQEEEEAYEEDADGAQEIEANEKNTLQSNLPNTECHLDTSDRLQSDAKEKQANGKIRHCQTGGRFDEPEGQLKSNDQGNGSNLATKTTRISDQKTCEIGYQQAASSNGNNEPLEKPSGALHVYGNDTSEDDIEDSDADDENMISKYSINFSRQTNKTFLAGSKRKSSMDIGRRKDTEGSFHLYSWEGVEKSSNFSGKNIEWKGILEFVGAAPMCFLTPQDLQNKWLSISRNWNDLKIL
ncbi:hypothetical protein SAY86_007255 [Trapa natans]|uniref:Zinc finger PHD-type domain-containing protein n=1 Tax=Trapa natans TaxID=22666 RepID=A0AAN7R009_TRANT|nr:hypothetical protein SAY86_007255 [Trapa natans]